MSTVLASTLLLMSLAACGTNNSSSTSSDTSKNSGSKETTTNSQQSTSSNEPIKLRIMWWGSQARHDATLKALEMYQELNPHITFEPEFSGWDGYWDKAATQSAARNLPDIIQMDASYLADYSSRDQLLELTAINTSDMDEALLNSGKYNGKQYAIPLGNNAFGMAYNKKAVESSGITVPQNNWTWDDYFSFGYEAKGKLDGIPYVLLDLSNHFQSFTAYQLSKGKGQIFQADGSINFDKDSFIEFQTKFAELRDADIVPPGELTVKDTELDPNADSLVNGTVIVRHLHAAQSNSLDSLNPGVYEMITFPRDVEAGGWLKPSMHWSVSANTKYAEESQKFIDWFINNAEVAPVLGSSRGMPVSKPILEQLTSTFSEGDLIGKRLIESTASDAQEYVPEPEGWSNFARKDYKDITEKIIFGVITPEQAYEELMQIAQDYQ